MVLIRRPSGASAQSRLYAVCCKDGICTDPGAGATLSTGHAAIYESREEAQLFLEWLGTTGSWGCKNGNHDIVVYVWSAES